MTSSNKLKKSHEAAVLNDVLSFCRRCGGYKKKQAFKLAGIIDSEHERPDLAIVRNDGSVVGLEHFRIDHHVGKDKKVKSKAAELAGRLEKERKTLVGRYEISIAADAEEIDPAYLWNTAIADTALALNLRRRSEPFAATVSVQMLYEALLSESRRMHGEITSRTVLALLGKIPRSEIETRMEVFDKRYGISRNAKREGSE